MRIAPIVDLFNLIGGIEYTDPTKYPETRKTTNQTELSPTPAIKMLIATKLITNHHADWTDNLPEAIGKKGLLILQNCN